MSNSTVFAQRQNCLTRTSKNESRLSDVWLYLEFVCHPLHPVSTSFVWQTPSERVPSQRASVLLLCPRTLGPHRLHCTLLLPLWSCHICVPPPTPPVAVIVWPRDFILDHSRSGRQELRVMHLGVPRQAQLSMGGGALLTLLEMKSSESPGSPEAEPTGTPSRKGGCL